jgi:choline-sulfatase
VVFSSDHGEMLGDHGLWGKSLPFHPSVSVPLVAAGPGVTPGLRSDAPASVMDLAATFLDYAGVARPSDMDSRSLRPVLEGRTRAHRECVLSGLNEWRMVWDGRYKLVTGFKGRRAESAAPAAPMLFDLERDPLENDNIAAKNPALVKRLKELLV